MITPASPDGPAAGGSNGKDSGVAAAGAADAATDGDDGDGDGSTPLEEVADAVTLWLGLADEGVYAVRGTGLDGGHPVYAGHTGDGGTRLSVWSDLDAMGTELAAATDGGDATSGLDLSKALSQPDVSLTPHDDFIFDLVVLAESITPDMDSEAADRLVSAWTELVRLAGWGGWTDLAELLRPDSPAGGFVVSCAVDLAQDRLGAAQALASADTAAAAAGWQAVIPVLTAHLDQRD